VAKRPSTKQAKAKTKSGKQSGKKRAGTSSKPSTNKGAKRAKKQASKSGKKRVAKPSSSAKKQGKAAANTRGGVALATAATEGTLGNAAARGIVLGCASTIPGNLPRTLQELGVNGFQFQTCVFGGVTGAGFSISRDRIPSAPSSTLVQAVNAIQDAPAS